MATRPLPTIPFVADIGQTVLANGAIVLLYVDANGETLARSLADADAIEALGKSLIGVAAIARAGASNVVALPNPRANSRLMRNLRSGDVA